MSETTETKARTVVWPTKDCHRCGGDGRHSYNAIDGDRCYGCGGFGQVAASRASGAIVAEFRAAVKAAKACSASDIVVGQEVYVSSGRIVARADGQGAWVAVTAIEETPEACSWSIVDGERQDVRYKVRITLADGTVHTEGGTVRTRSTGVDAAPYMTRCLATTGKTDRAKARQAYRGAIEEAGWTIEGAGVEATVVR